MQLRSKIKKKKQKRLVIKTFTIGQSNKNYELISENKI